MFGKKPYEEMAGSEKISDMILYTKKHKVGMKNALNISFRTVLILKKWMKNIFCLTHRFLTSTSWGRKKKKNMVAF